jgi:hypothetical protein
LRAICPWQDESTNSGAPRAIVRVPAGAIMATSTRSCSQRAWHRADTSARHDRKATDRWVRRLQPPPKVPS